MWAINLVVVVFPFVPVTAIIGIRAVAPGGYNMSITGSATLRGNPSAGAMCIRKPGPNLETAAEYKYLHIIGGDAVGMSTVPEVLAAVHMGLPVFAISVITDKGYPHDEIEPVSIESVIAVAKEAEPKMTIILKEMIAGL